MFFGIPQTYSIDIYGFYFEEYMLGYLPRYWRVWYIFSLKQAKIKSMEPNKSLSLQEHKTGPIGP